MADKVAIHLRLPDSVYKALNDASVKSGTPKNKIFNEAVATAIEDDDGGYCDKQEYVHTCVRLTKKDARIVKGMANREFLSANTMFLKMIIDYLGVEPCAVKDVEE